MHSRIIYSKYYSTPPVYPQHVPTPQEYAALLPIQSPPPIVPSLPPFILGTVPQIDPPQVPSTLPSPHLPTFIPSITENRGLFPVAASIDTPLDLPLDNSIIDEVLVSSDVYLDMVTELNRDDNSRILNLDIVSILTHEQVPLPIDDNVLLQINVISKTSATNFNETTPDNTSYISDESNSSHNILNNTYVLSIALPEIPLTQPSILPDQVPPESPLPLTNILPSQFINNGPSFSIATPSDQRNSILYSSYKDI